jgi:MFS family permease
MPPGPSVWTVMVALLGVHVAAMGAFLTTPVLAPAIAAETGLAASLAGLHTALVYAGALVSGPFTGLLLKRFGGIRVCQGALVTLGAGIALSTIGTPAALAASALIAGLGHGPVTPAGSHLLASRVPPQRRSLIFSLKQTGVPGGAMMVAAIAPGVATVAGWRAGALTIAGLALLGALALQPIRAAVDADRVRGPIGGLGGAWRDATGSLGLLRRLPALRALTFAAASLGVAQFCFGSFFVVMQVEQLGRSLAEAGLAMALAQAGGVVGRVAWGAAADRAGPVRVLMGLALGAAAASGALALAAPGWPASLVAMAGLAMGATAIGWNGVLLAEAARVSPAGQVGGATAALGVVFGLAMLVGPPAFSGLVALTGGYGAGFALCAASALAAFGFLRVAGRAIGRG